MGFTKKTTSFEELLIDRNIEATERAAFAFPELNTECLISVVIPHRIIITDTVILFRRFLRKSVAKNSNKIV